MLVAIGGCGRIAFDPRADSASADTASPVGGPSGAALRLDDAGHVEIDAVCPALTGPFTIQAWVKPSAAQIDTDSACVFGLNNQTGTQHLSLMMWDVLATRVHYFDDFYSNRSDVDIKSAPGTWHLFTATLDAAGRGTVYANTDITVTFDTSAVTLPCRFSIGQEWDGTSASDQFVGLYDVVSVWSVAKSQSEIIAALTANPVPGTPGLVALYTFDGGDARDDSGANYTGTLVGTAVVE
jgi:hypothetical protein